MLKSTSSTMTNKELKRMQRKVERLAQEAYISTMMKKYEAELEHVVTDADMVIFKARWETIADKLDEGYILDIDQL